MSTVSTEFYGLCTNSQKEKLIFCRNKQIAKNYGARMYETKTLKVMDALYLLSDWMQFYPTIATLQMISIAPLCRRQDLS